MISHLNDVEFCEFLLPLLREVMEGLVVKTTGQSYLVRLADGEVIPCTMKGNFRIKDIKSTNPIAVGDRVLLDDAHVIYEILDRENYIVRRPTNLSKQLHIIAANVSQVLLLVTIKSPETSTTFIDRFLAVAEAYRIPVILLVNKQDVLTEEEQRYADALCALYENIGYQTMQLSCKNSVAPLVPLLHGKTTLLAGNSGVGKSTIVNGLCPSAEARTAEVSTMHQTGMHTTTFSEMYEVEKGTFLIDTPGVKGFGTVDLSGNASHYFREIFAMGEKCRFANCTHTHEPGCAVLQAVENHYIALSRYQSYLSVMNDDEEEKYR